jgi:hypothetical protein
MAITIVDACLAHFSGLVSHLGVSVSFTVGLAFSISCRTSSGV